MAALAPFHARWEYVTIHWRDDGISRTMFLRFSKKDFPSFEREIVTQTGLTFEDAARERDATRRLIERRKSEALPLRLDRATFIRNELINGGLYQILIIEREPGAGNLFLFRGKQISWKKPVWVIPVAIVPGAEHVGHAEPEYSRTIREEPGCNSPAGARCSSRALRPDQDSRFSLRRSA